jgi:hypothetical protein
MFNSKGLLVLGDYLLDSCYGLWEGNPSDVTNPYVIDLNHLEANGHGQGHTLPYAFASLVPNGEVKFNWKT